MTWFAREPGIEWLHVEQATAPEALAARIARRVEHLVAPGKGELI
jgi:hypothetical protein